MEKDAPKGGPFGIPTNLNCVLLWFFTPSSAFPRPSKNLLFFAARCLCGGFLVRSLGAFYRRTLEVQPTAFAAGSRANRTAAGRHGQGSAPQKGAAVLCGFTKGRALCWFFPPFLSTQKWGPRRASSQSPLCLGLPLVALDPLPCSSFPPHFVGLCRGPQFPLGSGKTAPKGAAKKPRPSPRLFLAFQSRSARSISVTSTSSSTPFRNTVRVTVSPAENWFFTALNSSMVDTSAPSMAVIMSPTWMPWR